MFPVILQLLTPKVIKSIMDYVFKKNELDYKMEAVIEKVDKLGKEINNLKEKK